MDVNDRIRPLVTEKADAELIKRTAVSDGMVTLRDAAVRKMLNGETTFDDDPGDGRKDLRERVQGQGSRYEYRRS